MTEPTKTYVLTKSSGDEDGQSVEIVGLTESLETAMAWVQADSLYPGYDETRDWNLIERDPTVVLDDIAKFRDPRKNPECSCGHRLSEHGRGKTRKCSYHAAHPDAHKCLAFELHQDGGFYEEPKNP